MTSAAQAGAVALCGSALCLACASPAKPLPANPPTVPVATSSAPAEVVVPPPRLGLVLGGGAAKGFAHVGVIKALEAQSIHPDIVVGTSAGSLVGALYAAGYDGFALQRTALEMKESMVSDWSLPDRGIFKGESLQEFVNKAVQSRPIERLDRKLAIVATDLQSGQAMVFERGDTGLAVRASSSVPGLFQPVKIAGREYVDGGLVSPVPVKVARALGAEMVIAVDVSAKPELRLVRDTLDVLLQTFTIMGNAIAATELLQADIVIRPEISQLAMTDFESRHLAILEGEKAGQAAIADLRAKLAARETRLRAELLHKPVTPVQ